MRSLYRLTTADWDGGPMAAGLGRGYVERQYDRMRPSALLGTLFGQIKPSASKTSYGMLDVGKKMNKMKIYINSNPIRGAALVALLVGLCPAVSAEMHNQTGDQAFSELPQPTTPASSDSNRMQKEALRKRSAHELTGTNVKSRSSGDSLGRVKDFVIDARSGQVVYAVVGAGGVLGVGETLHAVPVSALNYEAVSGDERFTLDIDSARWAQAPRFKKDRLSSLQADQEGKATFQYYGQTWQELGQSLTMKNPVRNQGEPSAPQPQPAMGGQENQFVLTSDIIGKNIRSGTEKVGEIEDVFVQLQNRAAAVLLDSEDSFTGTDQKYIIPFSKLTLQGQDKFITSLTRQDFSSAQVVQGEAWASQPGGAAGKIYIWPGVGSIVDRVAQGMSRDNNQGQPPVAEIRRALQSDTTIAQQGGKDVQVLAQGDKVVLLGTVRTEEAKDQIEDRVEKAAPGWSIKNEIRVATAEE